MLVHQHKETEGASGNVVVIPEGVNFSNTLLLNGTTFSGVIFNSNGGVYRLNDTGSTSILVGQWLINGAVASFTIRRTVTNGVLNGDQGAGWLALTTNRQNDVQETSQPNSATVTFEISDDGGTTVLDSVFYTFVINT